MADWAEKSSVRFDTKDAGGFAFFPKKKAPSRFSRRGFLYIDTSKG